MKILTTSQRKLADAYTIEHEPIQSSDLMERAAKSCVRWLVGKFSKRRTFHIFVGPGNNGGDGLAIARLLAELNYVPFVFVVDVPGKRSADFNTNFDRLAQQATVCIQSLAKLDEMPASDLGVVAIDCIFGSGLSRPLQGFSAELVQAINANYEQIVAIDIPSGLFGEDNYTPHKTTKEDQEQKDLARIAIKAQVTLTFQFPFLSFFFAENDEYVGKVYVLPIGLHTNFTDQVQVTHHFAAPELIRSFLKQRDKYSHKGHYGHALLMAGSYGKMGAAILAAKACLRTGVGLLTAHIPETGYDIMQIAVPEAMLNIDFHTETITELPEKMEPYAAIGLGPGIGQNHRTAKMLLQLMHKANAPLVIDADALNIIAEKDWLKFVPQGSILTPHPKEFARLAGSSTDNFSENHALMEMAVKYGLYIVLKGGHTAVACPDGTCYFNTTGNPGMATAGSGDVLTGIILSLRAQGVEPCQAALFGVFLHGLAGDIAAEKQSQEALVASDIVENLGKAFKKLRNSNKPA